MLHSPAAAFIAVCTWTGLAPTSGPTNWEWWKRTTLPACAWRSNSGECKGAWIVSLLLLLLLMRSPAPATTAAGAATRCYPAHYTSMYLPLEVLRYVMLYGQTCSSNRLFLFHAHAALHLAISPLRPFTDLDATSTAPINARCGMVLTWVRCRRPNLLTPHTWFRP